MIVRKIPRPSPAFIVATIALFVALGGTAGAVVDAAVPLAKRALTADNAKKLGGRTGPQLVSQAAAAPGPASTAAGLVTIKTASTTIAANGGAAFTIACDAGQKILSGGYSSDGPIQDFIESRPSNETTWSFGLVNFDEAAAHAVTLSAVCIK
jgi:hypothetical protein